MSELNDKMKTFLNQCFDARYRELESALRITDTSTERDSVIGKMKLCQATQDAHNGVGLFKH
jgi:hypothetical protein